VGPFDLGQVGDVAAQQGERCAVGRRAAQCRADQDGQRTLVGKSGLLVGNRVGGPGDDLTAPAPSCCSTTSTSSAPARRTARAPASP
jgi:hypothetical protein